MAKLTNSQIGEAITAIKTKTTLEQVDLRNSQGGVPDYQANQGPKNISSASTSQASPLFNPDGTLYTAGSVQGTKKGLVVPNGTPKNSIIQYTGHANKNQYAIVTGKSKGVRPKGFKIKKISPQQLKEFQTKHPKAKIITVDESSLAQIELSSGTMLQIFDSIDPTETLFFKILIKSLLGANFDSESDNDLFLILYLRLILIAAVIVVITTIVLTVLL